MQPGSEIKVKDMRSSNGKLFWHVCKCFLHSPLLHYPQQTFFATRPPIPSKMYNQCFNFFWDPMLMQHFGSKKVYYTQPAWQALPLELLCENVSPIPLPLLFFLCHRSSFRAITLAETFATQAILWGMQKWQVTMSTEKRLKTAYII